MSEVKDKELTTTLARIIEEQRERIGDIQNGTTVTFDEDAGRLSVANEEAGLIAVIDNAVPTFNGKVLGGEMARAENLKALSSIMFVMVSVPVDEIKERKSLFEQGIKALYAVEGMAKADLAR